MKRRVVVASATVALVASAIAGSLITSAASATSGKALPSVGGIQGGHRNTAFSTINAGDTYTIYVLDNAGSGPNGCDRLTFASGGVFSGLRGDSGKWRSTSTRAVLRFNNGSFFPVGDFVGTYETGDAAGLGVNQYGGSFKQTAPVTATFGPMALVQGSNPWGVSGC